MKKAYIQPKVTEVNITMSATMVTTSMQMGTPITDGEEVYGEVKLNDNEWEEL